MLRSLGVGVVRRLIEGWPFIVACFAMLIAGCVVGAVTGSFAAYIVLDGLGLFGLFVGTIIEERLV